MKENYALKLKKTSGEIFCFFLVLKKQIKKCIIEKRFLSFSLFKILIYSLMNL